MMNRRSFAALVLTTPVLAACPAALSALATIASGAGWLGTQVDKAEAKSTQYLNRHPNMETEELVKSAIDKARAAAAALEASAKATKSAGGDDVAQTKADAMAAFAALTTLLDELGILSATPPDGGAENSEAPEPQPFELPDGAEVKMRLGE